MRPKASKSQSSLYIAELHPSTDEEELEDLFFLDDRDKEDRKECWEVHSIKVVRFRNGKSRGYAYVNFMGKRDAEFASRALNFSVVRGRELRMFPPMLRSRMNKCGEKNLFVKARKAMCESLNADMRPNWRRRYPQSNEDVTIVPYSDWRLHRNEVAQTNVYVKGLPVDSIKATRKKLLKLFNPFGEIASAHVIADKKHSDFGIGVGFVNYRDAKSAQKAVSEMHGKDNMQVELALPKAARESDIHEQALADYENSKCKIFVGGLDHTINSGDLRKAFEKYGEILHACIPGEKTHATSGYGIVEFSTEESASAAINGMYDKRIGPKKVRVSLFKRRGSQHQQQQQQQQPQEQPPQQDQQALLGYAPPVAPHLENAYTQPWMPTYANGPGIHHGYTNTQFYPPIWGSLPAAVYPYPGVLPQMGCLRCSPLLYPTMSNVPHVANAAYDPFGGVSYAQQFGNAIQQQLQAVGGAWGMAPTTEHMYWQFNNSFVAHAYQLQGAHTNTLAGSSPQPIRDVDVANQVRAPYIVESHHGLRDVPKVAKACYKVGT